MKSSTSDHDDPISQKPDPVVQDIKLGREFSFNPHEENPELQNLP